MAKFKVMYRETVHLAPKWEVFSGHSELLLRRDLEAKGMQVLLIRPDKASWVERIKSFRKIKVSTPRFGVSTAELALMCEVFRALYSSGVQMLQIVQMTIDETPNPWLRKKLVVLLERLRGGDDLAKSMSDPRCIMAFPPLMRETIRTGEANGRLAQSLERLVNTFKRMAETKQQTVSAMVYPLFTLIVFFGVCTGIAILIPDSLSKFIGEDNIMKIWNQLPGSIRLLFTIRQNPIYLFFPPAFIAGVILLCHIGMKQNHKTTRHALTCLQRRVPLIGTLLYHFAVVRFLEVLSANHESGIAIGESLTLVRDSVDDALIEESVTRVRAEILSSGESLSAAINQPDEENVYPGLVRQMIRAGEESGKFTEMLRPIMVFYDNQARALLKRILDLITPLMIVVLGSVVGPVILGVYQTIQVLNDAMINGLGG